MIDHCVTSANPWIAGLTPDELLVVSTHATEQTVQELLLSTVTQMHKSVI
jgi:hypothetical protein